MADRDESETAPPRQVSRLEWVVAGLSAALVAALLVMLVREALIAHDGPPVLIVTPSSPVRTEGGHVVRFTVENRGPIAAAEVTVSATLKRGEAAVEEAEVTLDYVARSSTRAAAVIFKEDPDGGALEIVAKSYRKP